MKYDFKERKNWIKSYQPNFNIQDWHNNKVYHPTDIKYLSFYEKVSARKQKINPSNIIGIEYAWAYNCPSSNRSVDWLYLLRNLKRLDRVIDGFKSKESLIQHIHKDEDPKSVKKYGGNYFTTSGQHRLCIAKYLEVNSVEVNVEEFRLNKKLLARELRIQKLHSSLYDYNLVDKNEYQLDKNIK